MTDAVDKRAREIKEEQAWRHRLLEETTDELLQLVRTKFSAATCYQVDVVVNRPGCVQVSYCRDMLGERVCKSVAALNVSRLLHDTCGVELMEGTIPLRGRPIDTSFCNLEEGADFVVEVTLEAMARSIACGCTIVRA